MEEDIKVGKTSEGTRHLWQRADLCRKAIPLTPRDRVSVDYRVRKCGWHVPPLNRSIGLARYSVKNTLSSILSFPDFCAMRL